MGFHGLYMRVVPTTYGCPGMIFQLYTPLQGLPGCPNLEGCDAEVDKELGNDGQLG